MQATNVVLRRHGGDGREIRRHAIWLRIVAGNQQIRPTERSADFERGPDRLRLGGGRQPQRLDVEQRDAVVRHQFAQIVELVRAFDRVNGIAGPRCDQSEADRIEAAGCRRLNKLAMRCANDGQRAKRQPRHAIAFSSEVGTGSREENASA